MIQPSDKGGTHKQPEREKTMTNSEIIFWASVDLMNEGKIGTTGRVFQGTDRNGQPVELPEPEPIHTFAAWKELGFSVKKGQHAVATIMIWKYREKKEQVEMTEVETGEKVQKEIDAGKMFRKQAYFFSASQVERTAAKSA